MRSLVNEVPFDIPDSWEWVRIRSLGEIVRGSGIKRNETVQQGLPCVRYGELYEKAKSRVEKLRSIKAARQAQADAIGAFMFEVQELDTLPEFDNKLWLTVIDTVTIRADGRMTFKFQGGTVIDA